MKETQVNLVLPANYRALLTERMAEKYRSISYVIKATEDTILLAYNALKNKGLDPLNYINTLAEILYGITGRSFSDLADSLRPVTTLQHRDPESEFIRVMIDYLRKHQVIVIMSSLLNEVCLTNKPLFLLPLAKKLKM